jgi:alginate lyase
MIRTHVSWGGSCTGVEAPTPSALLRSTSPKRVGGNGWRTARAAIAGAASVLALLSAWKAQPAAASPGALTDSAALAAFKAKADAGNQPQAGYRASLLADATRSWRWGTVSGEFRNVTDSTGTKACKPGSGSEQYLLEAAPDAYAQALGAHLGGPAALAPTARGHVLDLVDTTARAEYSGGNQCVLDLALSVPVWIETARLLEDTPGSGWSAADTVAMRAWLARVYPLVAWASRARRNNWGAAGSLSAWSIAAYLEASSKIEEYSPTRLTLTAAAALEQHRAQQLARVGSTWAGDAQCAQRGIQPSGGIPEELRRGSTGCDGSSIKADDASLAYQTMHVELLVFHAEALRRRGDLALYGVQTSARAPALLQAIRFVIANATRSWPWPESRLGTVITAATWYDDARLLTEAKRAGSFRGGRALPYARTTRRAWAACQ